MIRVRHCLAGALFCVCGSVKCLRARQGTGVVRRSAVLSAVCFCSCGLSASKNNRRVRLTCLFLMLRSRTGLLFAPYIHTAYGSHTQPATRRP